MKFNLLQHFVRSPASASILLNPGTTNPLSQSNVAWVTPNLRHDDLWIRAPCWAAGHSSACWVVPWEAHAWYGSLDIYRIYTFFICWLGPGVFFFGVSNQVARWCPSNYCQRRWEEWSTGGFWMYADLIFVAARRPLLRWISPWRPLVDRLWKEKLMTCRRGACLFSAPGVLKCLRKAVCKGNFHLKTYPRFCTFVDLRDAFDSLILKCCLNLIQPH